MIRAFHHLVATPLLTAASLLHYWTGSRGWDDPVECLVPGCDGDGLEPFFLRRGDMHWACHVHAVAIYGVGLDIVATA